MAQNITLMGASYSAVPSVNLPKTGGGTASFTDVTDTTATASDVASGKYFYTASGVRTRGTSSGGGGASNIVEGTFTTGSSAGAHSISLPYTGNGYPIACMVFIATGAYDSSNTAWYNSVQRYAVGQWTMHKAVQDTAPTYSTSGTDNQGVTTAIYKNSTSSSNTYARGGGMNTNVYSSSNAANSAPTCVRLKRGNVLSYYVNTSSYGLLPNMEYKYIVIYSE